MAPVFMPIFEVVGPTTPIAASTLRGPVFITAPIASPWSSPAPVVFSGLVFSTADDTQMIDDILSSFDDDDSSSTSSDGVSSSDECSSIESAPPRPQKRNLTKQDPPAAAASSSSKFGAKLTAMLRDERNADCITFDAASKAVVILNQKKLVDVVLPLYFTAANAYVSIDRRRVSDTRPRRFQTFHRQLNFYGFRVQRKHPYGPGAMVFVNNANTLRSVADINELAPKRSAKKRSSAASSEDDASPSSKRRHLSPF
mmetsp:Transcript_35534/g.113564  ORF Transcript_35534/g.113564 Transcript_35534/m.113564 type:complete len:256 (-) Transcript_35534:2284-3051(-)